MQKILLVEDDPAEARMYQRLFVSEGFEVYVLPTGENCHSAALYFHPDVILMDVLMPNVNGFEALDTLHFSDDTKDIPVIMLTNLLDSTKETESLRRGACSFITKSNIENSDLVALVRTFIKTP